ncbi:hypothetical protein PMZ80_002379 [Knufia obscura]|uniref:RING-type domain-containing protein n=2 Tax=Knufia TaxID=430999 RepID=A0AAN8I1C0_9EURO|nr:hypothetical protein PMZ80_002379 [Knufia obscura]KAK5948632.1 hypothetical protein OHC33_010391 [Knufia fluminis]
MGNTLSGLGQIEGRGRENSGHTSDTDSQYAEVASAYIRASRAAVQAAEPSSSTPRAGAGSSTAPPPDYMNVLVTQGPSPRNNEGECPVCQDVIAPTAETLTHQTCQLSYCRDCLQSWVDSSDGTCPYDREQIRAQPRPTSPPNTRRSLTAETRPIDTPTIERRVLDLENYFLRLRERTARINQHYNSMQTDHPHRYLSFTALLFIVALRIAYEDATGMRRRELLLELAIELDTEMDEQHPDLSAEAVIRLADHRLEALEFSHWFGQGMRDDSYGSILDQIASTRTAARMAAMGFGGRAPRRLPQRRRNQAHESVHTAEPDNHDDDDTTIYMSLARYEHTLRHTGGLW